MEITDRLKYFITEYCGISVREFEKRFGFSNGSLMKTKSLTIGRLLKIVEAYPEINIEWLFLGKGTMIKEIYIEDVSRSITEEEKKVINYFFVKSGIDVKYNIEEKENKE